MDKNENIVCWKHAWQIISGKFANVGEDDVRNVLFENDKDILTGILLFSSTSENDTKDYPEEISEFIKRASDYLHIHESVAWKIIKCYILNEYSGSMKTIQRLKYEMDIIPMLKNIWKFYSSERMFLIKILKIVLEFMNDTDNPFQSIYKEFVDKIFKDVWKSLVKQFYFLIGEIESNYIKKQGDDVIKLWINRNLHEIIEIIHCLIIWTNFEKLSLSHFAEILKLCKKHGFGVDPIHLRKINLSDVKLVENLTQSEIALLLCMANQFWTGKDTDWYSVDKELEAEIMPLRYRKEHGAFCCIWLIMHLQLPNKSPTVCETLERTAIIAAALECNSFFIDMVKNTIFSSECLVGACVKDAMFNMFCIGLKHIPQSEIMEIETLHIIFAELIKIKHICEKFFELKYSIGYVPIWSFAQELFPKHIDILSKLVYSIIVSDSLQSTKVIQKLKKLPFFTEDYNSEEIRHSARVIQSDNLDLVRLLEKKIVNCYGYTYEVPENTQAIIRREQGYSFIHYSIPVNYWIVCLTEFTVVLNSTQELPEKTYNRLIDYLNVLYAVLKYDETTTNDSMFTELCVAVFSLMNQLAMKPRIQSLTFFSICLDICTVLLAKCSNFVYNQMDTYKLLPSLIRSDFSYTHIFNLDFLDHGKVGKLIIRLDIPDQDILLMSYLKFLLASYKRNSTRINNAIVIPGTVFILKEVFPNLLNWFHKPQYGYNLFLDVLYEVQQFLFELICNPYDNKSEQHKIKLVRIVYEFFMNELCGKELLRILSLGNSEIQSIMESQTNWSFGRGIRYIDSIKKLITILMQLLSQRKVILGNDNLAPLELLLYSENDGIHTVKAVASYINNPYNEHVPNLAIRLLKRLTSDLRISMLAALDLEPDQIRMMFIQRLRNNLESEDIKLAVIELITACIPKQNGMTEAFFRMTENKSLLPLPKLFFSNDDSIMSINEGFGTFLVEYLHKFNTKNTVLSMSLLARVMTLFHTLWINQKEIVIVDLIKDTQFWPSITSLLFKPICLDDHIYAQLLNILSKEIYKKRGAVDEPLNEILNKMFASDYMFLDKWINYVFFRDTDTEILMETDKEIVVPARDTLILAFKDFMIICIRFLPKSMFTTELQMKFANDCRRALRKHVIELIDSCIITFVAELYYYVIVSWGETCFKNEKCFEDLVSITEQMAHAYFDVPNRFIVTNLAITIKSTNYLRNTAIFNTSLTNEFIKAIGKIFDTEFNSFMNIFNKNVNTMNGQDQKLIMIFETLKALIVIQNESSNSEFNTYLFQTQLIHKLYEFLSQFLTTDKTIRMAKVVLDLLITYAKSANSKDFLGSEIEFHLWEKILTPVKYRHSKSLETVGIIPSDMIEWWQLYKRMLILLTVLLQKHGHLIVKTILMFIVIHEDYLADILLLERYTVHDDALDLIKFTLILFRELLNYKSLWALEHESSLLNLLDKVKINIVYSSSAILRPSVLKYCHATTGKYEDYLAFETLPVDIYVEIADKLTELITLAINCVLQFSPPLFKLLDDMKEYSHWPLQVEVNFGIPTFGEKNNYEFTFGLLFCLTSIYVRILHQIAISKKMPYIVSPREILTARKNRLSRVEEQKDKDNNTPITETPVKANSKNVTENKTPNPPSSSDKDTESQVPFNFTVANKPTNTEIKQTNFIRIDYWHPIGMVSTVEDFMTYTNPSKSMPWYSKINEEKVTLALEVIISLIASQVTHILYNYALDDRESRLIKRELATELQSFHDYVKRCLMETHKHSTTDYTTLIRKKYGKVEKDSKNQSTPDPKPNKRLSDTRVPDEDIRSNSTDETDNSSNNSDKSLFEVKLINEDYLHFLSYWFSCFLHYD